MLQRFQAYDHKMAAWLFLALYGLALLGFSLLVINLQLADSLMFIFTIPILFSAFSFRRWVSWIAVVLLFLAAVGVTWRVSINLTNSLKTIAVTSACEVVIVEIVQRLIQSRRQAEEKLRTSEQKYKSLVEQIPIGVYRTDSQGVLLHANHTLALLFGFDDPQELILKHKAQDFNVDPTAVERQRQDYKQTGSYIHEVQLRRQDGRLIWVRDSANPIFDEKGEILYVDGTLEDITERKRIEEELDSERRMLRTLIDNLPDRIYVKNLHGEKILSNPADQAAIGAGSEQDVLGKTDFDLMPEEMALRYQADDQQVIESGKPLINRIEPGPTPFADECWILTTKVPLRDAHGNIGGLIGIGRDITDRRQIEEALHKANEKLTHWVNDLELRNREAKLLNDMGELLQSCHSIEDAYDVIGQFGERMFEQQSGALYIINNSRNLMEMVTSWGVQEDYMIGERVSKPDDCWALRRGRVYQFTHPEDRLRCKHMSKNLLVPEKETNFYPYICVPMIAQGETLGMMHVRFDEKRSDEVRQMVIAVAERAAMSLANLKLSETLRAQAVRDPLTGLFNRRYMEETLEREIRRAIRYQRPLGVIMLDIDHFKQFNDTFSYAAGDTLLRELGTVLKNNLRADDVTCRYGGEEFVLILPESSLEDTARRAENLREACKNMQVQHRGQALGLVTISLGVAAYPEHGESAEDLLRAVDTALHSSKSGGRDCVSIANFPPKS
jgi:diguanylate cyclase (GGDEF)-like protein/PAS domain S-box-containing protein